jgi:hypothetical protein
MIFVSTNVSLPVECKANNYHINSIRVPDAAVPHTGAK